MVAVVVAGVVVFLAVVLFLVAFCTGPAEARQADDQCQYRQMELNPEAGGPTVIHVKATRGDEVREFGYHESGVYPWVVQYEWCGDGWTVVYRLGSACTYWNGEYMTRAKEGPRQKPCEWTAWMPTPLGPLDGDRPQAPTDLLVARLEEPI